jgi:hypothetical protein
MLRIADPATRGHGEGAMGRLLLIWQRGYAGEFDAG